MTVSCRRKGTGRPGETLPAGWGDRRGRTLNPVISAAKTCPPHPELLSLSRKGRAAGLDGVGGGHGLEALLLSPFHICQTGCWGLGWVVFGTNAKLKAKMHYWVFLKTLTHICTS